MTRAEKSITTCKFLNNSSPDLSHGCVRWRVEELRDWIAAGCPDPKPWEAAQRRLLTLPGRPLTQESASKRRRAEPQPGPSAESSHPQEMK